MFNIEECSRATMKIWIFNHYAITPDLPGGTRHFDFGMELVKRGYEVTIFASSYHYSLLRETKNYTVKPYIEKDYNGVKFIWIKTFPYSKNDWKRIINMLSYSLRAYKLGKTIEEKPDIIIGSSVHLFAVYTAYLLAKYYKVSFIMEVRDLWPQTLIDSGISKWNPFVILLGILERFLYKKADKIITLLPKAHEYIESLGIKKEKIIWIPNGVHLERFKNFEDTNKEVQKSVFKVGYIGAIGKTNNLDVAVEAAEILKNKGYTNIKFVFVGDGPEKNRLLHFAEEKKLFNVEFKEAVPKKNIPLVYKSMDILFFCVKNLELFKYGLSSNKLFDYLASGKPIIFSSNSVNNPVEEAMAGITIQPDNSIELAEAIVKLYEMSEEKREEMGRNGRKYVEKYYSIPVLVDKLENVIKEVNKQCKVS